MSKIFDPWKTYDASAEEQKAILERVKMREALKAEFRKKFTDPYRPTTGHIFDPAVQRNYSARFTFSEYFRPSKYMLISIIACLIPLYFAKVITTRSRTLQQEKLLAGKASKEERDRLYMANP